MSDTADEAMEFFDELPGEAQQKRTNWARVKENLIAHEGQWGLIARNVSSSTPQQLLKGKNKLFRGEELRHYEFSVRRPENPAEPYASRRSDLYGRYKSVVADA
jgi:hypothetical protein